MLASNNWKIQIIRFCFSFLKTENKAVCESVAKYIKQGFSEEEAIEMYDANPNSKYRHLTKDGDEEDYSLPF